MNWNEQGGAAFPFAATNPSNVKLQSAGMSLRDWFAGQALANPLTFPSAQSDAYDIAAWAYAVADAMLEERKE